MLKQKLKYSRQLLGTLVVAIVLSGTAIYSSFARADQFDDQIQALRNENAAHQEVSNQLASQASSYQDAVNKLQSQIYSIQQAIVANQQQRDELQRQIEIEQAALDREKQVLGKSIKTMYLEGQISTLEILASSKDLSEFVDKEQYRAAVRDKIKASVDKITQLKLRLQSKKQEIEQLIKAQQAERDQLAATEAEQNRLLAYTEGQKASYDQMIKTNQAKIGELRRQQAILNSRFNIGAPLAGDPNRGGYPSVWQNAPQDSIVDYWGMYNRECVSYTAFRVNQDYRQGKNNRDMPYWGGRGNANQWDDNAQAAGISVDTNPTPGSIAVSNAGTWGHTMYVEQVSIINGQQAIYVSQYNAGLDGQYSEAWRYTTGLVFIHF